MIFDDEMYSNYLNVFNDVNILINWNFQSCLKKKIYKNNTYEKKNNIEKKDWSGRINDINLVRLLSCLAKTTLPKSIWVFLNF